uniref:Uncharacterized protein n=1 Tax=Rhizophora mucronata TaxID=61149 RepID=A0A2P2J3J7_RHIMU
MNLFKSFHALLIKDFRVNLNCLPLQVIANQCLADLILILIAAFVGVH